MKIYKYIVFVLLFGVLLFCFAEALEAQLLRRNRANQQQVCGPEGCYTVHSEPVYYQPVRTIASAIMPRQEVYSSPVQETVAIEVAESESGFHRGIIRAAVNASRRGDISRRDVIKIRVAMLSPAFRESAQDLAVTQMVFSGGDVPTNEQGAVEVSRIDWDGLTAFLEKLIPLLLQLLKVL